MAGAVLLYDADCGFCRWCAAKVLAWDRGRRVRPVALQSPEAERLLAHMTPGERMASMHVVDESGGVHSGGAALEPLLHLLPVGGPLARLAGAAPWASDRLYRFTAGHRDAFGPLVTEGAARRARRAIERRS